MGVRELGRELGPHPDNVVVVHCAAPDLNGKWPLYETGRGSVQNINKAIFQGGYM